MQPKYYAGMKTCDASFLLYPSTSLSKIARQIWFQWDLGEFSFAWIVVHISYHQIHNNSDTRFIIPFHTGGSGMWQMTPISLLNWLGNNLYVSFAEINVVFVLQDFYEWFQNLLIKIQNQIIKNLSHLKLATVYINTNRAKKLSDCSM